MRKPEICLSAAVTLLVLFSLAAAGQTRRQTQKRPTEPGRPVLEPTAPQAAAAVTSTKGDSDLVTIPLIATDANGLYVPDIRADELAVSEDGVPQKLVALNRLS